MLIKIGYDIALRLPFPTAAIYVLRVHSSRKGDLVGSEEFRIEPELSVEEYFDGFGNHCGRVNCPAGVIRFLNHAIIRDPGTLDLIQARFNYTLGRKKLEMLLNTWFAGK